MKNAVSKYLKTIFKVAITMIRSSYENSVAALLNELNSNRERLDALRLEMQANQSARINEATNLSFSSMTKNALDEVNQLRKEYGTKRSI